MEIASYQFTGPLTDVTKVPLDARGVYVVVDLVGDEVHGYLDVGEAKQLGDELHSHDRTDCWEEYAQGDIGYCYRITSGGWERDLDTNPLQRSPEKPRAESAGIVSELLWKHDFACTPDPWEEIEAHWRVYQTYEDEFGPRA